jgi:hypothetical protein
LHVIINYKRKCLSLDGDRNINHRGKSDLNLPPPIWEKRRKQPAIFRILFTVISFPQVIINPGIACISQHPFQSQRAFAFRLKLVLPYIWQPYLSVADWPDVVNIWQPLLALPELRVA